MATRACTESFGPYGTSTNTSLTGTEPGARSPGGVSSTRSSPSAEMVRTSDGDSAEDHTYSTERSGRTVAPTTVPAGVGSAVSTPDSRS